MKLASKKSKNPHPKILFFVPTQTLSFKLIFFLEKKISEVNFSLEIIENKGDPFLRIIPLNLPLRIFTYFSPINEPKFINYKDVLTQNIKMSFDFTFLDSKHEVLSTDEVFLKPRVINYNIAYEEFKINPSGVSKKDPIFAESEYMEKE